MPSSISALWQFWSHSWQCNKLESIASRQLICSQNESEWQSLWYESAWNIPAEHHKAAYQLPSTLNYQCTALPLTSLPFCWGGLQDVLGSVLSWFRHQNWLELPWILSGQFIFPESLLYLADLSLWFPRDLTGIGNVSEPGNGRIFKLSLDCNTAPMFQCSTCTIDSCSSSMFFSITFISVSLSCCCLFCWMSWRSTLFSSVSVCNLPERVMAFPPWMDVAA